ncbi:MAG: DUF3817 domain-containing protein [Ornithinibacter sp.]
MTPPRMLFTWLARAEVVTWTLLLIGMFLKYVTSTTDVAVSVFGLAHGVVFLSYVGVTLAIWVDQRWRARDAALALLAGVPPFATLWIERRVERRSLITEHWRLGPHGEAPTTPMERLLAGALVRPAAALVVGATAVLAVTAALLVIGPPAGPSAS